MIRKSLVPIWWEEPFSRGKSKCKGPGVGRRWLGLFKQQNEWQSSWSWVSEWGRAVASGGLRVLCLLIWGWRQRWRPGDQGIGCCHQSSHPERTCRCPHRTPTRGKQLFLYAFTKHFVLLSLIYLHNIPMRSALLSPLSTQRNWSFDSLSK